MIYLRSFLTGPKDADPRGFPEVASSLGHHTMNLLVVRHAEAVNIGVEGVSCDFDRFLTEHGQAQAKALAQTLGERGMSFEAVMSSPLVRAVQTGQPLLRLMKATLQEPLRNDYLTPEEFRPKKLSQSLNDLGKTELSIVGHNPSLSYFVNWLIGSEEGSIELEKAAAVMIEFAQEIEKGRGKLRWLLTPEWYLDPS